MINTYLKMLTYQRRHGSDTEAQFIERFLAPLGVKPDEFGNPTIKIGESEILWSSHTDTVHSGGGRQQVDTTGGRVTLAPGSTSRCLGADCTSGVFIMTEMIKAKVPGLYIFHRGEECGGLGSSWLAKNKREMLEQYKAAIAFDRYGTTSVITHQGGRCCSDEFGESMMAQLPGFRLDQNGLFTDTANYDDIIPECTNLSVGYNAHHTSSEYQDLPFLVKMTRQMIALDQSKLVFKRDPSVREYGGRFSGYGGWASQWMDDDSYYYPVVAKKKTLEEVVEDNPTLVAQLLEEWGFTGPQLEDALVQMLGGDRNEVAA